MIMRLSENISIVLANATDEMCSDHAYVYVFPPIRLYNAV